MRVWDWKNFVSFFHLKGTYALAWSTVSSAFSFFTSFTFAKVCDTVLCKPIMKRRNRNVSWVHSKLNWQTRSFASLCKTVRGAVFAFGMVFSFFGCCFSLRIESNIIRMNKKNSNRTEAHTAFHKVQTNEKKLIHYKICLNRLWLAMICEYYMTFVYSFFLKRSAVVHPHCLLYS